ncbi:MAG: hypothetical protein E7634_04340 [Ruminococcaceae bacterium]|nr:hypothetical protein [Oscillospiraceae bacterium]
MIWNREQYIAHCSFEYTGREMFCELFGPLIQLETEWRQQGATEKEISMTAFDWDYVLRTSLPCKTGAITGIKPITLEDTPDHTLTIDHMGRKSLLNKKAASISHPLEYHVKTMDDWLKVKHWYTFDESRINYDALANRKALRDNGYLTLMGFPGGFDEPRQLLGEEGLCIAYYDEPEMIEDMLNTMADTAVKIIERVCKIVPIDNLTIHEDLAGKSGPLIGPNQVREFLVPYYKKVWDAAQSFGAKLFSQDSDGNIEPVIEAFMEGGVNCFYPFEPAAGMDAVKMREKYGKKFYIKGGIDKFALREGKEAIERELEYKLNSNLRGGGTIFALDHRIPNGVTIENYRYYVNLGREMLGIPPITSEGWERMAF